MHQPLGLRDLRGDRHPIPGTLGVGAHDAHVGLDGAGVADTGVEHLRPPGPVIVAPGGVSLHGVDRGVGGGAPDLLRDPLDALGEEVPEALALGDHLEEFHDSPDVPPGYLESPGLLLGDPALLEALHEPPREPAGLVVLEPELVGEAAEHDGGLDVVNPDGGAPSCELLVLGLLHDPRVGALLHLHPGAVEEAAAPAGLPPHLVGVPEVLFPVGVDLLVASVPEVGGIVLYGEGSETRFLAGLDAPDGSPEIIDVLVDGLGGLIEGIGVVDINLPIPGECDDGLELLGAQDGARPVVGGAVPLVHEDPRPADEALPRRADGEDRGAPASDAVDLLEGVAHLVGVEAHDLRGVPQLGCAIFEY